MSVKDVLGDDLGKVRTNHFSMGLVEPALCSINSFKPFTPLFLLSMSFFSHVNGSSNSRHISIYL